MQGLAADIREGTAILHRESIAQRNMAGHAGRAITTRKYSPFIFWPLPMLAEKRLVTLQTGSSRGNLHLVGGRFKSFDALVQRLGNLLSVFGVAQFFFVGGTADKRDFR